jgi:nitrogen fixation NifU-like protein
MDNNNYTKQVMKHFRNPKNAGEIKNPNGIGKVGNPNCGDVLWIYLNVAKNKAKKDYIRNIKFKTMGCCAAISSSDVICSLAKGKTLEDAGKITRKDILKELGGLPLVKYHCSLLGEEALQKAIKNYKEKNEK